MTRIWLLISLLLAVCAAGCGVRPDRRVDHRVQALDFATIADLSPDARRRALEQIGRARAEHPGDTAMAASEGHLRLALGDWGGASDLLMEIVERGGSAPEVQAAAWRACRAAGALSRWLAFAERQGHGRADASAEALARWVIALAAEDSEAAERRLSDALATRIGDAWLLTAAAIVAARAERWGRARLLTERVIADRPEPPRPSRTVRALALAETAPDLAPDAFEAARIEDDPLGSQGEARFWMRHGRPLRAAAVLDAWLARFPLDQSAGALRAEIEQIVARVRAAEAAP